MKDVRVARLAGGQFNRVAYAQLRADGLSDEAIRHRVRNGRLVAVETGVYAVAPIDPENDWGRWMGAVLTQPGSVLSHRSAAAAWGFWTLPRPFETITRPGGGGPRRHGGLRVHHSSTLAGDTTERRGIPITTASRTLLDLAPVISPRALARCVRGAVRLRTTSIEELAEALGTKRRRRGSRRLRSTIARYTGLPLERARSGAEVRALEILRAANRPTPSLNVRRAGEEADLSWPAFGLIVELDGGPFHLDRGEDERKQRAWEGAGWTVRRLDADEVYRRPQLLLALAPPTDVPPASL